MKKWFAFLLTYICVFQMTGIAAAARPEWPVCPELVAEGAAVMDADSGALLFGKNSHQAFPPASITKILTALLVIEHCDMDEMVTFSDDAVNHVEAGSSNAELSVGDRLSVEDCLYAMLLKSANEAANALAEHVAGSRSAFVDMMNEKIAALGCEDSHFANPSGLNSPDQNVSPYDMCLIAREAFKQPELVKIASTLKYDLPPTIRHPEGSTIYMEHKMLLDCEYYYEGAIAGKTGYTRLAGNTLVTYAKKDGRRLVAVVMKDKYPNHYSDTRTMLDFGFEQFHNYNVSQNTQIMSREDRTVSASGTEYSMKELTLDPDSVITLPEGARFGDADETLVTELPAIHPEGAAAMLQYTYNDRKIGQAYLYSPKPATPSEPEASRAPEARTVPAKPDRIVFKGPGIWKILAIVGAAALLGGGTAYILYRRRREREALKRRRARRRARLRAMGCSEDEFNELLKARGDSGRRSSGSREKRRKRKKD